MTQLLLKNGLEVKLPSIVGPEYVNHWKDESFTNEMHHADLTATSSSSLKLITDSPYTYLSSLKDRQNGEFKAPNKSMQFGTLCHLAILEPEVFKKKLVMAPKFDMRTKIGKEGKMLFDLECPVDAVVLNEEEYDDLMGVIQAVLNHEEARNIFKEGVTEISGYFRDEKTGILIRIRPDFLSTREDLSMFIDLKTTRDSSYDGFQKQINSLKYHMQLALYRKGIFAITGNMPSICGWTAVENKKPYEVALYTADEAMIEIGDRWCRYALDRLHKCIVEKNFPQRQVSVENMAPSSWMISQEIPRIEQ